MAITNENTQNTLQLYTNPLTIQQNALARLQESVLNGKTVSDGNNVFTFLLEFMATMTAGAAGEAVNTFSGLYPSKAMHLTDLYKHMSDFDYVNLFSSPASTKLTLMFDRSYLINNAVQDSSNKVYHKVVVPSQTLFTIGGIDFGIYYPINIFIKKNIQPNGKVNHAATTFSVVFDTDAYTPLLSLQTNALEHRFIARDNTTLLCIDIPVYQFNTKTSVESTSPSGGFIKRYDYDDQFYAIRIFDNSGGTWTEMHQTLSDTIYDTDRTTAKIKVLSDINTVEVVIPQVYINQGMLGNKVMVKIYTSKGELNLDISNYNLDQFSVAFHQDEMVDSSYSDLLRYINLVQVVPTVPTITGGRNGMSFEELRQRVVHDSSYDVIITPRDLAAYFEDHNYAVSKYIDNITNRIYFVHKTLVDAKNNIIGAGDYNTVFEAKHLNDITDEDTGEIYVPNYKGIKAIRAAIDDPAREVSTQYLILPSNIYRYDENSNSMLILSDEEVSHLNKLDKATRVKELNNNIYSYNPFHTKLITSPTPYCVSYDLLNPIISNMAFVGENPNTSTQASVYTYTIQHLNHGSDGYRIYFNLYRTSDITDIPVTELYNGELYKNLLVVLQVTGSGGSDAYMLGEYIGDSEANGFPIFEFRLKTNYELIDGNYLRIDNFKPMAGREKVYVPLDATYRVMTFLRAGLVEDRLNATKGVKTNDFPSDVKNHIWLSTQSIEISLGKRIDMLYNSVSTTLGPSIIKISPTTTFATYERPVYKRYTELDAPEEAAIGTLKYPLEVLHGEGELILSSSNDKTLAPTCTLRKMREKFNIRVHNAVDNRLDATGTYVLEDKGAGSYSRVWRQISLSPYYTQIKYDTNLGQWTIVSVLPNATDILYRTNLTEAVGTPPTTGWLRVTGNTTHDTSVLIQHFDHEAVTEYNLMLEEPHTPTSWSGNTWVKSQGGLYLHGCLLKDVNGRYTLVDNSKLEHERVWNKIYQIDGSTIEHRISSKWVATQGEWRIEKIVDGTSTLLFKYSTKSRGNDPWRGDWHPVNHFLPAPSFQVLNFDNTNYRIVVEDILENARTVAASNVYEELKSIEKYIDYDLSKDKYSIVDPVEDWALFINEFDPTIPTTSFDEVYTLEDKKVGTTADDTCGALYIRDFKAEAIDPLQHLSLVQLEQFFDLYDRDSYSIEELAATFKIAKHSVKDILAWRRPWIKVLEATDLAILTSYLNTRKVLNKTLSQIRGYQTQVKSRPKKYGSTSDLVAQVAQISDLQMVWVEDVTNSDIPLSEALMEGDHYIGALGVISKSGSNLSMEVICHAPSYNHALAMVSGISAHSGCMYAIYETILGNAVLRYISIQTYNELGIDVDIANCPWSVVDKWPWDIQEWVDLNDNKVDKELFISLDELSTGAIVEVGSGDVVLEDGEVQEDKENRSLIYNNSMLHIDYKPTLSNELQHINYRDRIADKIRNHFTTLDSARASLLEQTNIYFKPIRTIGVGQFKHSSESYISMRLDMTMDLRLHVEPRIMVSSHLREMLEANIYSIVAKHLEAGTISQTNISRDILEELGDSVIYVDILGINGMTDLQTLVPKDRTFSPYIKQDLYVKDDGTIGVKSGINIKWVVVN